MRAFNVSFNSTIMALNNPQARAMQQSKWPAFPAQECYTVYDPGLPRVVPELRA